MVAVRRFTAALLTSLCVLTNVSASNTTAVGGAAGDYVLRGAEKVQSQLSLSQSGKFEWELTYSAGKLTAYGTWRQEGDQVQLTSIAGVPMGFKLESGTRAKNKPKPGTWMAHVSLPSGKPKENIAVIFVGKSGKKTMALTLPNGAAIAEMPSDEQWVEAGLCETTHESECTWIDIPAAQARERSAAFTVTNIDDVMPAPFVEMTLTLKNNELDAGDDAFFDGIYVKREAANNVPKPN